MKTLISGGTIVNEGKTFQGSVTITDGFISEIQALPIEPRGIYDQIVDATGCFVLPGIIDSHVHFRDPGLTHKADISCESRAAAAGGVTSIFDMPNTIPQTITPEALAEKFKRGRDSRVNYSFFYGATNGNADTFKQLDRHRIPGVKLFMGSSTGGMLVDKRDALNKVFAAAAENDMLVMAHCEDSGIINANMQKAKAAYGDDPDVAHHPEIRSVEACFNSTSLAIHLAKENHTRLHVAHLSTEKEIHLFEPSALSDEQQVQSLPDITAEAVVGHLLFSEADYSSLGTRIKCNPAIKSLNDRNALRKALADGHITTVSTDHAPHLLSEKEGGAARAMSGMPMVQFSLIAMLSLVDEGIISIERLVQLMAHNQSLLFNIDRRGYLRTGYHADITIVRPNSPWTLNKDMILSKCQWSPLEGQTFNWKVEKTFVGGQLAYADGAVNDTCHGEEIRFK